MVNAYEHKITHMHAWMYQLLFLIMISISDRLYARCGKKGMADV